jgi:hypothetical protein
VDQVGTYGTQGVADIGNVIGARQGHSTVMDSVNRVIYVMGGWGYGTTASFGMINCSLIHCSLLPLLLLIFFIR